MTYEYLTVDLGGAPLPHRALAAHLAQHAGDLAAAGGEVLGQFSPQLGFASNEAVVLMRWRDAAHSLQTILKAAPLVRSVAAEWLTPTARPTGAGRPARGGIYVHRWFTIGPGDLDAFVDLSTRGWASFEREYDASIFGLFAARRTRGDQGADALRLLLLTRYASHDVWEKSRNPSGEGMQIFVERQRLTRVTIGRSSLLVEPA
jgi:hypothetical protein